MREDNAPKERRQIDHHIFNGSIALIAVCITVISLFRVTKTGNETFADDTVGVATLIFMASSFLSYMSLRKNNHYRLESAADICFFIGLIIMLFALIIILFNI